jgi:hypothetical protein
MGRSEEHVKLFLHSPLRLHIVVITKWGFLKSDITVAIVDVSEQEISFVISIELNTDFL